MAGAEVEVEVTVEIGGSLFSFRRSFSFSQARSQDFLRVGAIS